MSVEVILQQEHRGCVRFCLELFGHGTPVQACTSDDSSLNLIRKPPSGQFLKFVFY